MHYLVYNLRRTQAPLLAPEELDPTEQAAYARRGAPYLLERSLLKHELARLTGTPAREIRFTYTEHGKPTWHGCHFSISHSGEWLCLAFHHSPIGVDIEHIRPRPRLASVAARIMSPQQLAAWEQRGCHAAEFYACWCTAEAIIKLRGDTMWHAPRYPFTYIPGGGIRADFAPAPQVELFEPAPGFAAALATDE